SSSIDLCPNRSVSGASRRSVSGSAVEKSAAPGAAAAATDAASTTAVRRRTSNADPRLEPPRLRMLLAEAVGLQDPVELVNGAQRPVGDCVGLAALVGRGRA